MLRITLSSTVEDARAALAETGQAAIVVWDSDRAPVGVVTLEDVSRGGSRGPDPGALLVDVMSHECVPIPATADVLETNHRYVDAAWASLKRRRPFRGDTLEHLAA